VRETLGTCYIARVTCTWCAVWELLLPFYRAFLAGAAASQATSYKVRLELRDPPSASPIRPQAVINRVHPASSVPARSNADFRHAR